MGSDNMNRISITAVYANGTTKQYKASQERFNWALKLEQGRDVVYEVEETTYDYNRTEIKSVSELACTVFRIVTNSYDARDIDNHLFGSILHFIRKPDNPRELITAIAKADTYISQDLFEIDTIVKDISESALTDILIEKCKSILGSDLIDIFVSALEPDNALASIKIENDACMYIDEELYDLMDVRLSKLELDKYKVLEESDPDFDEQVEALEDYISCEGIAGYIYDAAKNYLLSGNMDTLKEEIRDSLSQEESWDVSCYYYIEGLSALKQE